MANATQLSNDVGDEPPQGKSARSGGHFLLSRAARDFSLAHVEKMNRAQVHSWFVNARWGDDGTQVCPECGNIDQHYWIKTRWQWRCKDVACGRFFSVTSGTKFADRKLPLKSILRGMLIFCANVKGISACSLARQLGVAYQTGFVLLHKLRESIIEATSTLPLEGVVHIDGAHVSGRIRKPRVKTPSTKRQARDRVPFEEDVLHKNRRIIMTMRQAGEDGEGAVRTIVAVVPRESAEHVEPLIQRHVKKGSKVMTDELAAYGRLSMLYDHQTVNHSKEFSTKPKGGVNNNLAESYFARFRRMVIGQTHRVTPKYMFDYTSEVAWREDMRRCSPSLQVKTLLTASLKKPSVWWRGYWQGQNRSTEILFDPGQLDQGS
ncbi:IS1595 family transposase [Caenimonas sedimenti]|nr:IS1595 family transposase [Caenimonas sedimenti]